MINKFNEDTKSKQLYKFKEYLTQLPPQLRKRLIKEISHIHEKAYRRGFNQACSYLLAEAVAKGDKSAIDKLSDVTKWRISEINESAGAPLSIGWTTSLEDRLDIEMGGCHYLLKSLLKYAK